jgi:DNA-binding CsgD family transcriptional regulator
MKPSTRTTEKFFSKLSSKQKNHKNQFAIYRTEDDKEMIIQNLRFAELVFPKNGLTLCPVSHPGFSHFSENCEYVLGHDHQKLSSMYISDFFSLVHPEDLPAVKKSFGYIKNLEPFDPAIHRFSIYFRMKDQFDKYRYIKHDRLAIKTESSTYLYVMLFDNISDVEKFHHVKLEIYKKNNGSYVKINTYIPNQQERKLTPRQNDIARLIIRGFTNQEIADHLNVSIYTIKNHKQTLFKKAKVRNSIELANFVR